MAMRIHVVGVRNTTEQAVRDALVASVGEDARAVEIRQRGGWHWFSASAWGVSGSALDEAMAGLSGPYMRCTTEDGDRWYMLLQMKGHQPYLLCHQFADFDVEAAEAEEGIGFLDGIELEDELAFLRDEEYEAVLEDDGYDAVEELLDEYEAMGCPIPAHLASSLEGLERRAAVRELHGGLAEMTVEALTCFGIPHAPDDVLAILSGSTMSEGELESDLGDLPRFLCALGFGEVFEKALEQQLGQPDLDGDEACGDNYGPRPPDTGEIDGMLGAVGDAEAVDIDGGPVALPVDRVLDIQLLSLLRGFLPNTLLRLTYPDGHSPDVAWSAMAYTPVRVEGATVWVSLDALGTDEGDGARLNAALQNAPDGAELEMLIAHTLSVDSGRQEPHAFTGTVRGGVWEIGRAWPPASAEAIRGALELYEEMDAETGFEARDVAEAEAIIAAAGQLPLFGARPPRRDGLRVHGPDYDTMSLASLFFRHRWGDVWDCSAARAREQESRASFEMLKQAQAAPRTDEVVLDGATGAFYAADMAAFDEVHEGALAAADAGMAALGYQPLGDLVAAALSSAVVRGYGKADGNAWGAHMQIGEGVTYNEFYTQFGDGTSLTTTSNFYARNIPAEGIYMRSYEGFGVEALHEKHLDGISRFDEHKGTMPTAAEPTLQAFAAAVDEFLARRLR